MTIPDLWHIRGNKISTWSASPLAMFDKAANCHQVKAKPIALRSVPSTPVTMATTVSMLGVQRPVEVPFARKRSSASVMTAEEAVTALCKHWHASAGLLDSRARDGRPAAP